MLCVLKLTAHGRIKYSKITSEQFETRYLKVNYLSINGDAQYVLFIYFFVFRNFLLSFVCIVATIFLTTNHG